MKAIEFLQTWMDHINQGNMDAVIALYDERATLLPTFSSKTLATNEGIRDYFEQLGGRPNVSVTVHGDSIHVQDMAGSVSVLSGIYTFRFDVDGRTLAFEARFTIVMDTAEPAPILHHHSSQIPRGLR